MTKAAALAAQTFRRAVETDFIAYRLRITRVYTVTGLALTRRTSEGRFRIRVMLRGYGLQIVYRASFPSDRAGGTQFEQDLALRGS